MAFLKTAFVPCLLTLTLSSAIGEEQCEASDAKCGKMLLQRSELQASIQVTHDLNVDAAFDSMDTNKDELVDRPEFAASSIGHQVRSNPTCLYLGQGPCMGRATGNFLRGWDGKGLNSISDCISVCQSETDCGFVSYCPPEDPRCKSTGGQHKGKEGTCTRFSPNKFCTSTSGRKNWTEMQIAHDTYEVTQHCTVKAQLCNYLGQGPCDGKKNGFFLRGWDNTGLKSISECIKLCQSDADCGFVSYCPPQDPDCLATGGKHEGKRGTCTRYAPNEFCTPVSGRKKDSKMQLAHATYKVNQNCIVPEELDASPSPGEEKECSSRCQNTDGCIRYEWHESTSICRLFG